MLDRTVRPMDIETRIAPTVLSPLIGSDPDSCRECWGCVRCCPAKAIRVIERRSQVITEKCVECGLCVSECGHAGHVVRDDTPIVRDLLASGRLVVAVLASEYVAALHPMTPTEIERSLESIGFCAVESTVIGEEMVAIAYDSLCTRGGAFPVLRSTCPVTVSWVRRYHPELTKALAPVVPPYVAQARLVKALYPEGTAVVYVSPCYARKDEVFDPEIADAVDVAIDFFELRRLMEEGVQMGFPNLAEDQLVRRPSPMKELSLTDGFPRNALAAESMTSTEVQVVRGLPALDHFLCGLERGEAGPVIVDMLNCEGCIDGPAVNPRLSVFAKRNIESSGRETQGRSVVSSRMLLRHLPSVDLVRSFEPAAVRVPEPEDAELDRILADGGFASRADAIDCGACGYRTCVEHAIAIYQGNSTWDMCFPLQRTLLRSRVDELEVHETLDELTGLWNRRMFAERLVDEMARFDRYGVPVALLMIDIDGFAAVNDRFGRAAGDEVLARIGAHVRSSLRVSDLPARYSEDAFAVVLPGMHKTNAWAVAEKLRTSIESLRPRVACETEKAAVELTVSVGVAAASSSTSDAPALIEAADNALFQAKGAGKNQVRLAAD